MKKINNSNITNNKIIMKKMNSIKIRNNIMKTNKQMNSIKMEMKLICKMEEIFQIFKIKNSYKILIIR